MKPRHKTHVAQIMTAVVIVNTYSRRGERLFFKALDALHENDITVVASYPIRQPGKLQAAVKEALARQSDVVIVGGGDGTISSIVDQFAYKKAVLGLLPLGTGNSFVRTLGIPLSLDGAIRVIKHGKAVSVDLGKVDDDYFANVVSIGFAADVARETPRALKRLIGPLAYGLIGLKFFFLSSKFRADLVADGKKYTVHSHNIIVANGSTYGIMPLTAKADVDSGRLIVIAMDMVNRWQHLRFWLHLLLGSRKKLAGIRYIPASRVSIKTTPAHHIDIDGETMAKTPAVISVTPAALTVMVPKDFHEHQV